MFSKRQQVDKKEFLAKLGIQDITSATTHVSFETIKLSFLHNPNQSVPPREVAEYENFLAYWNRCQSEMAKLSQLNIRNINGVNIIERQKNGELIKLSKQNVEIFLKKYQPAVDGLKIFKHEFAQGLTNATERFEKISSLLSSKATLSTEKDNKKIFLLSECYERVLDNLPDKDLDKFIIGVKSDEKREIKSKAKADAIELVSKTQEKSGAVSRLTNSRFFGGVSDLKPASVLEKQQRVVFSGSRLYGSTLFCKADEQEVDPAKQKQKETAAPYHP